jgi:hypothetical protein
MKKTLLLLTVSAISVVNAQSISVNDTLTTGDKTAYFEADNTAPNQDATAGANVTWDYSTLSPTTQNAGSVKDSIIDNTNTDYPDAYHQEQFDGGINVFFTNTPTEVTSYGFIFDLNGQNATIKYDVDPMQSAVFPMAFGSSDYVDVIDGHLLAVAVGTNVNIAVVGTATVKADGTGTLLLGTTTFTDVIRIKTIEVLDGNVPAIPGIFAGGPVTITRTSYAYYSLSDSKLPVFLHGGLTAIVPTQPDVIQVNVWSSVDLSTGSITSEEMSSTSIFPNPATELVSIESSNATSINIFNTVGQVVYSNSNPSTIESVDVSTFETGIYIVEVKNNEIITTEKLIIE